MRINGREIAQHIREKLELRVEKLRKQNIIPRLAVIKIGNDPATTAYVNQKQKVAEKTGIQVSIYDYPETASEQEVSEKLQTLDKDKTIHGIILQLPIPHHLDQEKLLLMINPKKDIDGFHPQTTFVTPLAEAVIEILKYIHFHKDPLEEIPFEIWLQTREIVVLGKGKTGGQPVTTCLRNMHLHPTVIDRQTKHPEQLLKQADIIICAVGKQHLLTKEQIKQGVILIGIGMNKGVDGKFYGDYNEEEIKDIASWYTPIPGGVGPVNVVKLLENAVIAAEKIRNC